MIDSIVIKWILTILFILLILTVLSVLSNLSTFLRDLANKEIAIEKHYNYLTNNINTIPTKEKLENSIGILNMCNNLIIIEINNIMKQYIQLNTKYDYRKLDVDSKEISVNVYNALNPEIFNTTDILIDSEYLMKYITDTTIKLLLSETKSHNAELLIQ